MPVLLHLADWTVLRSLASTSPNFGSKPDSRRLPLTAALYIPPEDAIF